MPHGSSDTPCDMAGWISGPIAERCPNAVRCVDPFHVIQLATDALDEIRREVWNDARRSGQTALAKELKGARFALWKNPENLTDRQKVKLAQIQTTSKRLVPRLPARGAAAPDLPAARQRGDRAARSVAGVGQPQPARPVRQARPHDPRPACRDRSRHRQRTLQRPRGAGQHHSVVITALRADHSPGTNHEAGRAMDIGAVDGEPCRGGRDVRAPSWCASSRRWTVTPVPRSSSTAGSRRRG
jgi:hypothetical protein